MARWVIDSGNTAVKVGVFEGNTLLRVYRFIPPDPAQWDEVGTEKPSSILLSDVAQRTFDVPWQVPLVSLKAHGPWPFQIQYAETIGVDRLVLGAGLWALHGTEGAAALSLGTCLTVNVLQPGGVFVGGPISPGLQMRLQAMHHFTAKLPLATLPEKPKKAKKLTPKGTESALLQGAIEGYQAEIKHWVDRIWEEFPRLPIYFTGGDGSTFVNPQKKGIFASPNLTLDGLNFMAVQLENE